MIFDLNAVELIGHYGGDETHALSAWTSTHRDLDGKRDRIPALLNMLARKGHTTPFEKSSLHFLVRCDTASHIHLIKHRIGVSINAESARYKELKEPSCYLPYDFPADLKGLYQAHLQKSYDYYHEAIRLLEEDGLTRKRAKEAARYFLPYGNQLTMDVMFNWKSFMHFQGLRNKDDAQREIRGIADQMLHLVRNIEGAPFKHSLEAFGYES